MFCCRPTCPPSENRWINSNHCKCKSKYSIQITPAQYFLVTSPIDSVLFHKCFVVIRDSSGLTLLYIHQVQLECASQKAASLQFWGLEPQLKYLHGWLCFCQLHKHTAAQELWRIYPEMRKENQMGIFLTSADVVILAYYSLQPFIASLRSRCQLIRHFTKMLIETNSTFWSSTGGSLQLGKHGAMTRFVQMHSALVPISCTRDKRGNSICPYISAGKWCIFFRQLP